MALGPLSRLTSCDLTVREQQIGAMSERSRFFDDGGILISVCAPTAPSMKSTTSRKGTAEEKPKQRLKTITYFGTYVGERGGSPPLLFILREALYQLEWCRSETIFMIAGRRTQVDQSGRTRRRNCRGGMETVK